jgi:S-DNA-T family DNA segregation ATPase FtsK/SpoIIIE
MDVVIRSSQGEAEVTIAPLDLDATLAEVVEDVTGRPPPRVVYVDGRAVPSDTSLGTSGVLVGSVLDVGNEPVEPPRDAVVELVQLAGHGAGERLWLTPGQYKVGPGRRVHGGELVEATVDDTRFELRVAAGGTVEVRCDVQGAVLDGVPFGSGSGTDGFRPWRDQRLFVGGRVFALDHHDPNDDRTARRMPAVDVDGLVAFNRPPRLSPPERPPPTVPPAGPALEGVRTSLPLGALVALILAPVLVGVGMALVLGSPGFLIVALASPVLAVVLRRPDGTRFGRDPRQVGAAAASVAAEARRIADQSWARSLHPTFAELTRRAVRASPALWERRAGDEDAFQVPIGLADRPWERDDGFNRPSEQGGAEMVAASAELCAVPIVADLAGERGIGIVADPDTAAAMARGVMLAAGVLHGPADLDMVVLTAPDRLGVWEWAKWMPHLRHGGGPAVLSDPAQVASWAAAVRANWERPVRPTAPDHVTLVVVDQPALWRDRTAPLRPLLGDGSLPVRFVVLAPSVTDVPAVCTTVVTEAADDRLAIERVLRRDVVDDVAANLVAADLATEMARSLASLDDPDLPATARSPLPTVVPILDVLGLPELSAHAVVERWSSADRAAPATALGIGERGPFQLDLVADGPHVLIAGAAGSGTSELLRSLIAGLALSLPPEDLTFVLVDLTGGSAFDACSQLPHTVAMVTDLDEHLADRLVRQLRAELRRRASMLERIGAAAFEELRREPGADALPRLVVVLDECAPAALELPDLLPSLVDIAERGRSLGIHVILATQRPAAVVDERIRSTVGVRIALRVLDEGDSLEVIDSRDAASLERQTPGRALARLASGDLVEFQAAMASAATEHRGGHRFGVRPFVLGRALTGQERRLERRSGSPVDGLGQDGDDGGSDLARLVRAADGAARLLGQQAPRACCPDPLPRQLEMAAFFARHPGDAVPFGLIDLPDEQRQAPAWWHPGPRGNVVAYGIAGTGTSALLISLALGAAERFAPDDLHLYAVDADAGALAPLAELPHCGGVVRLDEVDRLGRLLRFLTDEIEARRARATTDGDASVVARSEPIIVVLVDDVGSLRQRLDDGEQDDEWEAFERVIRDGPALGMCVVMTAKHERVVPAALTVEIGERLALRLGDQFAYAAFGFRTADLPEFVPGRALRIADRTELQLVEPPGDVAAVVASIDEPAIERPPRRIVLLPAAVSVEEVCDLGRPTDEGLSVAVGVSTSTAEPVHLDIDFGSAVFVTGPPRSGRSSVLVAIAEGARRLVPDLSIFAVGPRGGPLSACDAVDDRPRTPADVDGWIARIAADHGRTLVLVDDAERLGGAVWEPLTAQIGGDCAIVVAGSTDDLLSLGHWSRPLQATRTGVLIQPAPADAALLDVSLGARPSPFAPGTGLVVNDGAATGALLAIVTEAGGVADDVEGDLDVAGRGGR